MKVQWLGRVGYAEALALQEEIVARKAEQWDAADELLLLEHDSVFTIGRTSDHSSLRDPAALPAPLVAINRGGQATWHGPGQLVGYPLLELRRRGSDLHRYLRDLEEFLILLCGDFGVVASRKEGLTGVWVGDRKIASLGVGVRRWISMHGFALNVCGPLEGFAHIIPCGIKDVSMTSLEREGATGVTVEEVARKVAVRFPAFMAGETEDLPRR
jgi:lipoyl(octanoyl) transferase